MIKLIFKSFLILLSLLAISCRIKIDVEEKIIPQTIVPGAERELPITNTDSTIETVVFQKYDAQILIDRDYTIFEIQNINIDGDEEEEQIILAGPLNDDRKIFKIFVADYDPQKDEYIEIYRDGISENNLKIASIVSEDITGDHFNEVIITGIDTKGLQVYEIFKVITIDDTGDTAFVKVFSQAADGDFELHKPDRGNDYKIDNLKGESYILELQKKNPEDEKSLIIEKYKWNETTHFFDLSNSEKVKISLVSNENLLNFYRGTSEDFLQFLSGPWYKVKDLDGIPTHNMNEIFQILPEAQTLTFFSNDIQESFTWADDKKPIKYRNALSFYDVRNNFLKSMYFSISIYIESFDSIQVKIRGNERWGGTYTQLTENLQYVLTDRSRENSLISDLNIKGLFKTNLNTEIIFDNPEYILKENGIETKGIYTIFDLYDDTILEMKELNANGLTKEVKLYKMNYSETSDDFRIIRTITLQKGKLKVDGLMRESNSELHFEQIEKINQDVSDPQS
ncbi:MAG: pallilysin-related adhesin [Spirochaetaceae bacterium]|nr:pallilysin-related adhesin [Spirochaetaceae bacterium]